MTRLSPLSNAASAPIDVGALRPVLDALPVLLLAFDADGNCLLSEGGLLARFGIGPGADVSRGLADFYGLFPERVNAVQRALAGETLFTRGVGGGPVTMDMQWHPQRDVSGQVAGLLVLATETSDAYDVSSVVRAEQAYRALLAAIPDQLFRLGVDGRATMVKPANDPEALQLPVAWSPTPLADVVDSDISERLSAAATEVLATGSERFLDHQVGERGAQRFVEARLIPETDDQVLGIVRDVTKRRHVESERREASKLEALGRLSAGVAHEINTPIQFVSHNVEFMSDAFAAMHRLLLAYREALHSTESLPWSERSRRLAEQEQLHDVEFLLSEVPQAVGETLEGMRRVATIVRALKQFSHPSGRELRASDVNDSVRNAVVVSTNEHKHVAEVELQLGDLPSVVCDPGELTQVFLNLIVNAAHALKPLVEARGRLGRIEISTRAEDDDVIIRVRDDGPGISYVDQEQVFDAFFTTKEVGKGTGQGLTLARSIVVDRHGGDLNLHSVPGQGTTFEVRLPIAGPPAAETASPASAGVIA